MSGHDVTVLLQSACAGDPGAPEELLPLVYDELRRLAGAYLAQERKTEMPQATSLVHQAYLRLVDQTKVDWQGRGHFCAVAAIAMRRLLVDHARKRATAERAGKMPRGSSAIHLDGTLNPGDDLVALEDALTRLADHSARKARVVELRFFGGLSLDETADVLDVSRRTVAREWRFAKAWLHKELTGGAPA